ncbi:MAG: hypothetical protein ACLQBD_07590 [Syntrophobacteraceae bacterium]
MPKISIGAPYSDEPHNQSFFSSSFRAFFSAIAVQWEGPALFVGQGDKMIIHPQWIVPVWRHRNISLGYYLGNSRERAHYSKIFFAILVMFHPFFSDLNKWETGIFRHSPDGGEVLESRAEATSPLRTLWDDVYLYFLMEVLLEVKWEEGKDEKDRSWEKANVRGGYHCIPANAGTQFIPDSEKHFDPD